MSTPTMVPAVSEAELRSIWAIANGIAVSGIHRDVFRAEDAYARILAGRDLGLSPTDSIQHMRVIGGQFVPSAEIQLALLKRYVGPDGERYNLRLITPQAKRGEECHVEILRRDPGEDWVKVGKELFTLEDAAKQELAGEFWDKVPRKMLFWRAVTNAIDAYAPEVLHPERGPALAEPAVDPHAPDVDVDLPLPVAADPMEGVRVDDPGRIKGAQLQHLKRFRDELQKRGNEGRLVELLDVVGAPEHEEVIQRICGLDENQAAELIMRLGRGRPRRDGNRDAR